jgi:hypothetical protein
MTDFFRSSVLLPFNILDFRILYQACQTQTAVRAAHLVLDRENHKRAAEFKNIEHSILLISQFLYRL